MASRVLSWLGKTKIRKRHLTFGSATGLAHGDPIINPSQSPYAVFNNNPILENDVNGNSPDFFQSVSKAVNTAISVYKAAKTAVAVAAHATDKVYSVYKAMTPAQKQTTQVTAEFITGLGPERRDFKAYDPITKEVANSHLTEAARQDFYKKNKAALLQGAKTGDYSKVENMANAHKDFGLTGWFDKSGILKEGNNSAAQMVGGAIYSISLSRDHKSLEFHVEDIKGRYSLFLHGLLPGTGEAAKDKARGNGITPMGNTYQSYEWSEPINSSQVPQQSTSQPAAKKQ